MGAVVWDRDPTDRFVEAGVWEHGCDDDRIAAQVRSMRMGECITSKLAELRKRSPPFDNAGHTLSLIAMGSSHHLQGADGQEV